jgi:hypothetical protein
MVTVTEASSTIRPPKVAYKETPYESPAKIGNGAALRADLHETAMSVARAPSPAAHLIKGIEEAPSTGNDALIQAVQKIYAAVTGQIAYHEREAKRLRESLAPFASISRQSDAPIQQSSAEDRIRELLDLADKLPQTGEQAP